MSEEATLRDVTVPPDSSDAAEPKKAAEPAKEQPIEVKDPGEAEAAEVGRILLNSGYSKAQINELLQAPQALASIHALLNTDPKQFVKQYALSNPTGAEKLRDVIAEEYVELHGTRDEGKKPADGKAPDSALMGEVAALREKVTGFESREQQRASAAAMASTRQRYDSRVDDFFGQDGVKNLGLTKSEERGMRALLDKELAVDQTIVQRVSNGNFVDVAPTFKRIIEGWASDRKAAAEADRKQRDNVQAGASYTFPGGPNPLDIPASVSESWDATEEGFAKALQNAR